MQKIVMFYFALMILPDCAFAQSVNDQKARAYYFIAESAYEDKQYSDSREALDNAEELLGTTNPLLTSLKIKILYEQEDYSAAKRELNAFFRFANINDDLFKEISGYMVNIDSAIEEESYASWWHLSEWESLLGVSWWLANPEWGDAGGYANNMYRVLDTEIIDLRDTVSPELTFSHRYNVEPSQNPVEGYDGWDGMNVRISKDEGMSWTVLTDPSPAYTNSSLFSFGDTYSEGVGVPGWTGEQSTWEEVNFDLSEWAGELVQIRFAFASDLAGSTAEPSTNASSIPWTQLFGWQLDAIRVNDSSIIHFLNNGEKGSMTARIIE